MERRSGYHLLIPSETPRDQDEVVSRVTALVVIGDYSSEIMALQLGKRRMMR
jgi:hypothetical protein